MSLLDESMEKFTIVEKRRVKDGYGGYQTEYYDGVDFMGALVLDNSLQGRTALKEGVTDVFTLTTDKSLTLSFHDIVRRDSDQVTFRVTSNGAEKKTPDSATLNMRQVSAEKWSLTNE